MQVRKIDGPLLSWLHFLAPQYSTVFYLVDLLPLYNPSLCRSAPLFGGSELCQHDGQRGIGAQTSHNMAIGVHPGLVKMNDV